MEIFVLSNNLFQIPTGTTFLLMIALTYLILIKMQFRLIIGEFCLNENDQ